jgi:DNA helicase HerA-like ATPase
LSMPVQSNKEEYQENIEDNAKEPNYLLIHLGEHWIIVGKTGAGKTYFTVKGLLEYIKQQFPTVPRYIIDSTNDPKMPELVSNPLWVEGNKPPDLLKDTKKTLVWTPDNSKIPSQYCDFFDKINDSRQSAVVVVDETLSMTRQAEAGLETLFRQLRKHGGIVIAETQEISGASTTYFKQATHYVQMRVNASDYDDRRSRSHLDISKEEQRPPLAPYGFFHRNTSTNIPMKEYAEYTQMFQGVKR